MYNINELKRNKDIKSSFLQNRPIPDQYRVKDGNPYGYIYCIENKNNGRKYIGATFSIYVGVMKPTPMSSLMKRCTQYIYEYNCATNPTASSKKTLRPIIKAIVTDGIENFSMYPLAETTKDNHTYLENYFIDLYDTRNLGYNTHRAGNTNGCGGRKQSIHDKQLRSEGIISVNMNNKQLIQSESMKLFADYLGTSKDMIKNSNRKGMPYKGWFVFYINKEKRFHVLINNVINDQDKRKQDRHSDKSKDFYKSLYNSIDKYLSEPDKHVKDEYFPGFERLHDLMYEE